LNKQKTYTLLYNSFMEMIDITLNELIDHLQAWLLESKRPGAFKAYVVALILRARLGDIVIGEVPLDVELTNKESLGLMMKSTYMAFKNAPVVANSQLGNTRVDRFLRSITKNMQDEIEYLSKRIFRDSNALLLGGGDNIWREANEALNDI